MFQQEIVQLSVQNKIHLFQSIPYIIISILPDELSSFQRDTQCHKLHLEPCRLTEGLWADPYAPETSTQNVLKEYICTVDKSIENVKSPLSHFAPSVYNPLDQ